MKLKLDREEGGRLGSAEKARKVILEKKKKKSGQIIDVKWTCFTLNGYMDDKYAARISLFAISSPMTDIANQPQHFSYSA